MRMKLGPIAIVAITLASFAMVAARQFRSSAKATYQAAARQVPARLHPPTPTHITYLFLFRSTTSFRKAVTQAGKPKAINPTLRREANLSDRQAEAVDEISATTLQEVEQQDARAREVIENFRAQFPNGKVSKDQRLPPPPPELQGMQEERNAIILRGRERLRSVLSDQEFNRFDDFVMGRFAAKGLN